jgi:hypothetical protein
MNFYAYLWMREDGTPYYAGKGKGDRAFHVSGHVVKPPKDKSRILLFDRNSEQEAFDTECELIRNWGRKDLGTGCLRNMTNGGDGPAGLVRTPEMNRKLSVAKKGKNLGQVPWNKGKTGCFSAAALLRLSTTHAGKPKSAAHRLHISQSLIGIPRTWAAALSLAKQKSTSVAKWAGNHKRWHAGRGISNPSCALCLQKEVS